MSVSWFGSAMKGVLGGSKRRQLDSRADIPSGTSVSATNLEPLDAKVPSSNPSKSSLFALIIGIDQYRDDSITDLRGAVADADAVSEFLVSTLGISRNRIINLRNQEATRTAMLTAIRSIGQHPDIDAEDPVLIYFAGHGSEARSPLQTCRTPDGAIMIQMLLPHDFVKGGSTEDEGQGIFDITMSYLLSDIARRKSDNITVILDCCHSASGTRAEIDTSIRSIDLPLDYSIPILSISDEYWVDSDTCSDMIPVPHGSSQTLREKTTISVPARPTKRFNTRGSYIPAEYEKSGIRSHVLLAACQRGESARESHGRGNFTRELLALLVREGIDRLTYTEIIDRIPPLPMQHPQCEGTNRARVLFDSKVPSKHRNMYKLQCTPDKPGQYIMWAGHAHGITENARFDVYADRNLSIPPIGCVVSTRDIDTFTSQCLADAGGTFIVPNSTHAYAVPLYTGRQTDFRVLLDADDFCRDALLQLFDDIETSHSAVTHRRFFFSIVKSLEEAPDLVIWACESYVQFYITNSVCCEYGFTRMPVGQIHITDTVFLTSILCKAADFYTQFHHSGNDTTDSQIPRIEFESLKLVRSGTYTDELYEILMPDPNSQNTNIGGIISIDVGERDLYVYRINNRSNVALYAALFYFDIGDLRIIPYYLPGAAADGHVDVSIPPNGSLTIGFGDTGTPHVRYYLRPGQNVDIGFLKLYLSTQFVDFSCIEQSSVFESHGLCPYKSRIRDTHFFDTLIIPVIQRREIPGTKDTIFSGDNSSWIVI